ncbi:MAG: urea ABC transporter permease subunit UrtC [Trueperaceae bacterium]|nr:urea ABC transporter permease subunit UrtC [Trueperaceae bacterium]
MMSKRVLGFSLAALLFLALFLAPSYLSAFKLSLLGRFLALGILGIGISLIWGYTGILSLGQGLFFALGGYAVAMHMVLVQVGDKLPGFMARSFKPRITELPWWWQPFESPIFATVMVFLLPALTAVIIATLVFWRRISGVYFALITQALVLAFTTLIVSQQSYTNGFNGLTNFSTLYGFNITSESGRVGLYLVTVVALLLTWLLAQWLTSTHFGKVLVAIRDGENRTRFLGYNTTPYKVAIFTLAGVLAGVSGAFFTMHAGIISPKDVGIAPSIEMVVWVAIGGRESITGAVLGMVLGNLAADSISSQFPESWPLMLGVLFVIVGMILPKGLVGIVERFWPHRQEEASPALNALKSEVSDA